MTHILSSVRTGGPPSPPRRPPPPGPRPAGPTSATSRPARPTYRRTPHHQHGIRPRPPTTPLPDPHPHPTPSPPATARATSRPYDVAHPVANATLRARDPRPDRGPADQARQDAPPASSRTSRVTGDDPMPTPTDVPRHAARGTRKGAAEAAPSYIAPVVPAPGTPRQRRRAPEARSGLRGSADRSGLRGSADRSEFLAERLRRLQEQVVRLGLADRDPHAVALERPDDHATALARRREVQRAVAEPQPDEVAV